jgi:phosphate transport system permease protein
MSSKRSHKQSKFPAFSQRRNLLLGNDADSLIKAFFGSSAILSIFLLALITVFLIKEGAGFAPLYKKSLQQYRLSGLEYVDLLKDQRNHFTGLSQDLNSIKAEWINQLKSQGLTQDEIQAKIFSDEAKRLFFGYLRVSSELKRYVKKKMDAAIELRDQSITNANLRQSISGIEALISRCLTDDFIWTDVDRDKYLYSLQHGYDSNASSDDERLLYQKKMDQLLAKVPCDSSDIKLFTELLRLEISTIEKGILPVDFQREIVQITGDIDDYESILDRLKVSVESLLANSDSSIFGDSTLSTRFESFKKDNRAFFDTYDRHISKLKNWDQSKALSITSILYAFITGKDWITASDQQDWYGLLPLLSGSLLISAIALFFAIPLGVGAAIYVNQIANSAERNLIKPYVEFISAIPSVVIGFFGVVVLGEFIRFLSQLDAFSWLPFFPIQERLNAFTAGCLLALMAIPTIFTLAEDAINNVPKHLKEASLAMGATPIQTTIRVIVPTALSGIISAIMLGFGRVIGETMVVLLCAGNRIKIPDLGEGFGVIFEPVHTMTGIVAQEMGEVVHGSVHYRALFMIGIVLFFISLIINYGAQWIVKKYNKLGD